VYVAGIIMLMAIFFCRFVSLIAHNSFRTNMTTYPISCSSWAEKGGCTRVNLFAENCTNAGSLPARYVNTFNSTQPEMLNGKI
jgi:hypothetical protein